MPTLGPFLSTLIDIVSECETYRDETVHPLTQNVEPVNVYRCTRMTIGEVEAYEALLVENPEKKKIHLHGFLSAFSKKEDAINHLMEQRNFINVKDVQNSLFKRYTEVPAEAIKQNFTSNLLMCVQKSILEAKN